jgi:hypothetical protein
MNLTWLDQYEDPYLKKDIGRGIFLSGVALGLIAACQNGKGSKINDAPLFKKLSFGKLQKRDIKKQLGEIPVMLKAYSIPYSMDVVELAREASELLMMSHEEMGVDGNFVFSTAFLNAWKYFYRIFDHTKTTEEVQP